MIATFFRWLFRLLIFTWLQNVILKAIKRRAQKSAQEK